jgi:hypothetical protein
MALFGGFVTLLAAIASALGVFARGDGTYATVTSARGVVYEMATNGVYAYNAKQYVAEGVGWDIFTLLVAVPAMLVALYFVARGSFRARLFAIGMFGYFLYMYLEYAMTWAFGPLFVLFVAIYGLSLAGIAWYSISVSRDGLEGCFSETYPRRSFAALNVIMSLLLALLWSARIAAGLNGDLAGAGLFGETTLVIQALDLGLVIPIALFASWVALKRYSAGYALGAAWIVTYSAMSAAIAAMLLSASVLNNDLQLPPLVIFTAFLVASAVVGVRIYRGTREQPVAADEPTEARVGSQWVNKPAGA